MDCAEGGSLKKGGTREHQSWALGNSRDACKHTKLRVPIKDEDRRRQHLAVGLIDFCCS